MKFLDIYKTVQECKKFYPDCISRDLAESKLFKMVQSKKGKNGEYNVNKSYIIKSFKWLFVEFSKKNFVYFSELSSDDEIIEEVLEDEHDPIKNIIEKARRKRNILEEVRKVFGEKIVEYFKNPSAPFPVIGKKKEILKALKEFVMNGKIPQNIDSLLEDRYQLNSNSIRIILKLKTKIPFISYIPRKLKKKSEGYITGLVIHLRNPSIVNNKFEATITERFVGISVVSNKVTGLRGSYIKVNNRSANFPIIEIVDNLNKKNVIATLRSSEELLNYLHQNGDFVEGTRK